ncbi:MAG: coproporphyrinogen dehydrogenase HemZ [Christensenellaceae bacterium]|jgi:oxygen-independent coproporphyrinogen-3 oxidase|nr:coproporphyrinogen dehydrogenase HemZ [Christensenellaceae bacterium]
MSIIARFDSEMPDYMNDIPEILRAYDPHIIIDQTSSNFISVLAYEHENSITLEINSNLTDTMSQSLALKSTNTLIRKREAKRFVQNILYEYCLALTNVHLPYGSLTGVHPAKLANEAIEMQVPDVARYLCQSFHVMQNQANLIYNVAKNARRELLIPKKGEVDIYVNIPFCTSRCKYCSFISVEIWRVKKQINEYIKILNDEIEAILKYIDSKNYSIRAIYVGGGTPTALTSQELWEALHQLQGKASEFTVEAGRPDGFTIDKMQVIEKLLATRISLNPQTLSDDTLKIIGRNHTFQDFEMKFEEVRKNFGFDINVDFIAGLPGEMPSQYYSNVLRVAEQFGPENITLHSFSLKRGSEFREKVKEVSSEDILTGMSQLREYSELTRSTLQEFGYIPYYMYRQKNTVGNLENVGFSRQGSECKYNMDSTNENVSILAAGAGAMTKWVHAEENRIERYHNPKGFREYIERMPKRVQEILRVAEDSGDLFALLPTRSFN